MNNSIFCHLCYNLMSYVILIHIRVIGEVSSEGFRILLIICCHRNKLSWQLQGLCNHTLWQTALPNYPQFKFPGSQPKWFCVSLISYKIIVMCHQATILVFKLQQTCPCGNVYQNMTVTSLSCRCAAHRSVSRYVLELNTYCLHPSVKRISYI